MHVPNFAVRSLRNHTCGKCGYRLQQVEAAIVGGGLRKRQCQHRVGFSVEIECPSCGRTSLVILDSAVVKWNEVAEWVANVVAEGGIIGETAWVGKMLTTDLPPTDLTVDLRLAPKRYLTVQLLGGYRRGKIRMILFRRKPRQQHGEDGQAYDGVFRLNESDAASLPDPSDENFMPLDEWPRFHNMSADAQFRLGRRTWKKMSLPALEQAVERQATFYVE